MMQSSTRGSLRLTPGYWLSPLRGLTKISRQEEFDMGIWFLMKHKRGTPEWIDHLLNYSVKLTRRIAEAEARGDAKTVNLLIRKKNQVNRWRRSITYVGR